MVAASFHRPQKEFRDFKSCVGLNLKRNSDSRRACSRFVPEPSILRLVRACFESD